MPSLRCVLEILFSYALCRFEHIFGENAVALLGIVYKNVRNSAHQPPILNNRTAAHECVKRDTTHKF